MKEIFKSELYKLKNSYYYFIFYILIFITIVCYCIYLKFYIHADITELLTNYIPSKFNLIISVFMVFNFIYEEEYTLRPDLHYTSDGDGETQSVITAWDQYVTYNNTFTAEGNATLNMYLSRFNAFGTEFIADEMPDGELHITISSTYNETTYTSSDIIVTNEDTPVEQIFNIGQPLYSVSSFQYSGLPCTLNFIWKRENGDVVTLKPANINFQKNKKYIITVKVNPYTGISLTLDDNSFNQSQTESWEIVTGNAIKTE